jgi:homoserine O-acetyltransferase/O-succinyltransferase
VSAEPPPIPASGAWRPGDEPGRRLFATVHEGRAFQLELGGSLDDVTVAYETWGTLDTQAANAVLVLHALTGDSHAHGPAGPGHPHNGWWDDMIGPGRPLDTDRFFIVCPNVLGGCQGTTGPASPDPHRDGRPYGGRFPVVTIRDQVRVEELLAQRLGILRWRAVVGGSMGGMRALEWTVTFPYQVETAIVLAVGAAATAEQIGLCSIQCRAIRSDPRWRDGHYYDAAPGDGPHEGLGIARRVGQISYRTELELHERFGREAQGSENPVEGGRYAIESYLDYHAERLARRFDANTYVVLSEAMNHHDVGRGRGGVAEAMRRIRAELVVAGIDSDRLYPLRLQEEICALAPSRPRLEVISSLFGHDAFLIEADAVGRIIADTLSR